MLPLTATTMLPAMRQFVPAGTTFGGSSWRTALYGLGGLVPLIAAVIIAWRRVLRARERLRAQNAAATVIAAAAAVAPCHDTYTPAAALDNDDVPGRRAPTMRASPRAQDGGLRHVPAYVPLSAMSRQELEAEHNAGLFHLARLRPPTQNQTPTQTQTQAPSAFSSPPPPPPPPLNGGPRHVAAYVPSSAMTRNELHAHLSHLARIGTPTPTPSSSSFSPPPPPPLSHAPPPRPPPQPHRSPQRRLHADDVLVTFAATPQRPGAFGEGTPCPICLAPLCEEPMVAAMPCAHMGHESCLRSWLIRDRALTCPVCRVPAATSLEAEQRALGAGSGSGMGTGTGTGTVLASMVD